MSLLSYNQIIIAGRLTADPAYTTTQSGISHTSFSVAVDRPYLSAVGERATDFFECTAWRAQADFIAKYFKKGSSIFLMGEMQNNNYIAKNGKMHYKNVISVKEVRMIDIIQKETESDILPEDQVPDEDYIPSEPPF